MQGWEPVCEIWNNPDPGINIWNHPKNVQIKCFGGYKNEDNYFVRIYTGKTDTDTEYTDREQTANVEC